MTETTLGPVELADALRTMAKSFAAPNCLHERTILAAAADALLTAPVISKHEERMILRAPPVLASISTKIIGNEIAGLLVERAGMNEVAAVRLVLMIEKLCEAKLHMSKGDGQ